MGLYKICEHKGRPRDRCDHAWWGSFRGKRVSLNWAVGREYVDRTPFRRGTEVLVRLEREDNKRGRRAYKDLTPDGQQRLREINLHWHDLRHEYASRLVEKGVPLAQVRDLLGHASIVTTERYDNQRLEGLQAAVARLEDGKVFDAVAAKEATENLSRRSSIVPTATAELSRIFQVTAEQSLADGSDVSTEISRSN